jgi:Kef-type K+ transport system membrane component KefB/Trk K+ transport system NAD-binding subunit
MVAVNGDIFLNLGLVVILASIAAFILRLLRQPQILAYVLVGVLITPVFKVITNTTIIESMSIIGIAFLLFIVGLEMDLKKLKSVALVSSLGGILQVVITFVVGYLVALLLGFLSLQAAYIGLFITFSSTMVVLKLLSDKNELNTLHGRIVVGILLLQDIIAIFAISILTSINDFTISIFSVALLKFLLLFALAFIASKYIFPRYFRYTAKNQELLLISSLGVCFLFSLMFHYLGFSLAIGAFIAGLTLGNLRYSYEIIAKVRSLRDFFSLMFFVSLGMGISLGVFSESWFPFIIITLLVVLFKPLLIMILCSLFQYTKKPSFLSSLSLGQMGEFSLILAAQGLLLGHITQDLFSLVVIITLFSITLTSYFIKYDQWFYRILEKPLSLFDKFTTEGLEYLPTEVKPKIILAGHNRIGYSILKQLHRSKKKILVVDYNPEIISMMVKEGYHCIYGNVTDAEIIHKMNLKGITMFVSTVPDIKENLFLIHKIRNVNKRAKIIVTANEIEEALRLYNNGADYVILPHFLGGEHVANIIASHRTRKIKLREVKAEHIKHLKDRKTAGHEHPKEN